MEIDLLCVKEYGFDHGFYNELLYSPEASSDDDWQNFMQRCIEGEVRTYSQRYKNKPEILEATDKNIIKELDRLVLKIIEASKNNNLSLTKKLVSEIHAKRKE